MRPRLDLDGNNSTLPGTNYHTTFTENGTAVAIADTDTLIGDPDIGSTDIASATITLTNRQTGDTLAVFGALPGGHHRFRLRPGHRNPHALQCRLRSLTTRLRCRRSASAPLATIRCGDRIIEVVVNDGYTTANPRSRLITVVAVNDAPALTVNVATYRRMPPRYCFRHQPASPTRTTPSSTSPPCRSPPGRFPATATP